MNSYSHSINLKKLGPTFALVGLMALIASPAIAAGKTKMVPAAVIAAADRPEPMLSPEEFKRQSDWRDKISTVPQPKKGCFISKFPA